MAACVGLSGESAQMDCPNLYLRWNTYTLHHEHTIMYWQPKWNSFFFLSKPGSLPRFPVLIMPAQSLRCPETQEYSRLFPLPHHHPHTHSIWQVPHHFRLLKYYLLNQLRLLQLYFVQVLSSFPRTITVAPRPGPLSPVLPPLISTPPRLAVTHPSDCLHFSLF